MVYLVVLNDFLLFNRFCFLLFVDLYFRLCDIILEIVFRFIVIYMYICECIFGSVYFFDLY